MKEFGCPVDGPLYTVMLAEISRAMKSKLNAKSSTWWNERLANSTESVIQSIPVIIDLD